MTRHVLITGCSGGGKSTVLSALAARGHRVVEEPGRRIVLEELVAGGSALPWIDLAAFARRALTMARDDLAAARARPGTVFCDRGVIDAAVALRHVDGTPLEVLLGGQSPYEKDVFLAPPWPEIYAGDAERRHDFEAAEAEFHRLRAALDELGHTVHMLPKTGVAERVRFILATVLP
jgi:predicted ATPase